MENKDMEFVDSEHEDFYKNKLAELKKVDVYHKSIIYVLGICKTTRDNFKKIFDLKKDIIEVDSLQSAWQTETSKRVTRMALNLWNTNNMYESGKDREMDKISKNYNISEMFCDGNARYFMQAIKLRYPENFKDREYQNNRIILLNNGEKDNNEKYGIYIRLPSGWNEVLSNLEIEERKERLLEYCQNNNISVNRIYCDIGYGSRLKDRISLMKLTEDINSGKLKGMVAESFSNIIREDYLLTTNFLDDLKGEIITIQEGTIDKCMLINKQLKQIFDDFYANELMKKNRSERIRIGKENKKRMQER